jgi:microcystin-dependent protein
MAYEGSVIFCLSSGVNGLLDVEGSVYILADGRSLVKSQYPELYAVISGRYGQTVSDFVIPDLRGYYLRGDSLNSNRDQDYATRTLYGPSVTATGVGTLQPAAFNSHSHDIKGVVPAGGIGAASTSGVDILTAVSPGNNTQLTSGVHAASLGPNTGISGIGIVSGTLNPPSYSYYAYIKAS